MFYLIGISVIMSIVDIPSAKAGRASFYENSVEDYSYSTSNTTQTLTQYSMCMSTRPVGVYVTARPVDASIPHMFQASVVTIYYDSAMVELTRIDANEGWNWMALEINWIVYMTVDRDGKWYDLDNGYSYRLLDTVTNHAGARRACKEFGAWLVVHGEKDQRMIQKLHAGYTALGVKPYWVGLMRVELEDKWIWDDWTPLTTSAWYKNEPNGFDLGENCVINGLWNVVYRGWFDLRCESNSYHPLCEMPTLHQ